MFVQNSTDSRRFFMGVRKKMLTQELLQPLEAMIANILNEHPEYNGLLTDEEKAFSDEYLTNNFDVNPFLHLGLHVALQEQLDANRPAGIASIYQSHRMRGLNDEHQLRHLMMGCLSNSLYKSQTSNAMPDEAEYLECLKCIG